MIYKGTLLTVENMEKSKSFYQKILNQKIKLDLGGYVVFQNDLCLQEKSLFAKIITIDEKDILKSPKNIELYFEEDAFDAFVDKLKLISETQLVHNEIEHPWGQRVIRFFDPDMHIIEVGESMEFVAKRFLNQGFSAAETAEKIQFPVEFVEKVLKDFNI